MLTIGNVIKDFRDQLRRASTTTIPPIGPSQLRRRQAPFSEPSRNKAKTTSSVIEADVYVMVDGDDTYDANAVKRLIEPVLYQQPVAAGTDAYRPGHRFGNTTLIGVPSRTLAIDARDMLSGYRAMSRRFVKSFPALSEGFEIETESPSTRCSSACASLRSPPPQGARRSVRSASFTPTATAFAFCAQLSCA
ncbi:hypothetical protein [Bradyrhizobium sp. JYMT SZCCT0428]|uniref:hypothetical protein n=1 Tax=Bradyrhizobium sp. JYMT SZCCT0428 TaxID=2807673 RepID=UPI001BA4DD06|nr:hypothetical protein [Bradyrhizobium sp. JYMT SZCCT0428]MBR1153680.1 hypothetical protein [Bradyrhizobium sp. JYMT SZCCT0428]